MTTMHTNQEQEIVNGWLSSLGAGQGGVLNDQGSCFLVADNEIGLIISSSSGSQQVSVSTHLLNLPISLSPRLYEELLALNLDLKFNKGTCLFFDKKMRVLGLLVSRDIEPLDNVSFRNLLDNFKEKALEIKVFIDDLLYGGAELAHAAHQADGYRQHLGHAARLGEQA